MPRAAGGDVQAPASPKLEAAAGMAEGPPPHLATRCPTAVVKGEGAAVDAAPRLGTTFCIPHAMLHVDLWR